MKLFGVLLGMTWLGAVPGFGLSFVDAMRLHLIGSGQAQVVNTPATGWAAGTWLSPTASGLGPIGVYTFTFPLGNLFGPGNLPVSFNYAADDFIVWSLSGGGSLSSPSSCTTPTCYDTLHPLTISNYTQSTVLIATITNISGGTGFSGLADPPPTSPTGIALADVPEPSTWAMFLLFAGGVVVAKRRLLLLPILAAPGLFAAPLGTGILPWTVTGPSGITTVAPIITARPPQWVPGVGPSSWIGSTSADGIGAALGTYVYALPIGAIFGTSGSYSIQYAADDFIVWSISGGGSLSGTTSCITTGCWATLNTLNITFTPTSTLSATVINVSGGTGFSGLADPPPASPTGVLAIGDVVPEPSSLALLGLATAMVALRRRN